MQKKEKKTTIKKNTLFTWLFRAPIKFTLTFLLISLFGGILYAIIAQLISPAHPAAAEWPLLVIMLVAGVAGLRKLIKHLPSDPISQTDFIATTNGITLSLIAMAIAYFLLLWKFFMPLFLVMNSPLTSISTAIYALIGLVILALIGTFLTALIITNLYATYVRALHLGVPSWKAALSMPFSILWLAGYAIKDKKESSALNINNTRYGRLTRRIVSSRVATWLCMLITLVLACLFFGTQYTIIAATFIGLFAIWFAVRGSAHMRENIGGAFATVAVILNIIILAGLIVMPHSAPQPESGPAQIPAITQTIPQE